MIKKCNLSEATDGKIYSLNDMVRIGCSDCNGCSKCCREMGESIQLDPLDVSLLLTNLKVPFEQLINDKIELNVVGGIVLPNLRLTEESGCAFLTPEGRCSIHSFRPGLCRLFPLGRVYSEDKVSYVLLTDVCAKEQNRTKMKLREWLDTPELIKNQKFLLHWYHFLMQAQERSSRLEEHKQRQLCMMILEGLYLQSYDKERDIYPQLEERLLLTERRINRL